jgi:UDP-glucose 4-epimerase
MTTDILVTGGAGYIGAHMCKLLAAQGYRVTVFDNLSTGHARAVRWGEIVHADLRDRTQVMRACDAHSYAAIFHFGGCSLVGESMADPRKYYDNNVGGTLNLLPAMREHDVQRIIFSSTAAIYGNPESALISEGHPKRPINPYGRSKWMIEQILDDCHAAYGLQSAALRYFNAAGASDEADIGEDHNPETHLIPNVLRSARLRTPVRLFGKEYPTPDGTCVRDYIHVTDLCFAHLAALDRLEANGGILRLNLGTGCGHSVREVIDAAAVVCGKPVAVETAPPRAGDPATLVACADLAHDVLGWQPQHSNLLNILETAWRWETAQVTKCNKSRA